jgi:hypothetical protein
VTKSVRHTADYFKKLPDADPMADKPTESPSHAPGDNAVKALIPQWADKFETDEGVEKFPSLPEGDQWSHLADTNQNAEDADADGAPGTARGEEAGWVRSLLSDRAPDKALGPAGVIEDDSIRMRRTTTKTLSEDGFSDPLQRLRKVGLQLAKNHDGGKDPAFLRTNTEGMAASDYPLPGTSFAVMGIRGSFGRQQVASAKVESDRLFMDRTDTKHAGLPDLRSAPLTAYRARAMRPGERYKVSTERSILAESGIKYTPTPLPGVSSSMFHDLGPSGKVDFVVALEGETSIEVVRGFGSKVAVTISARDERVEPGKDRSWSASVGAYVDASLIEYAAQSFSKFASKEVENGLTKLEDRKRHMDQHIQPSVEKFNKGASAKFRKHNKTSTAQVTLYEVVFDLSNSKARKAFNTLVGGTKSREVDFSSLADASEDNGVQIVSNNVRNASRTGIERTFRFFGFESQKSQVTESSETQHGIDGDGTRIRQEKHGEIHRTKTPTRSMESTTIGRVKTVWNPETDEAKTGVGFGWRYAIEDTNASPDAIADLLAFASVASRDKSAQAKLQRLTDIAGALPRRKVLGLPIGGRGLGTTGAEFSVELNVDAVNRLLEKLDGGSLETQLWSDLASGYAKANNLEETPVWPVEKLNKDGALGAIRRKLTAFKDTDGAFLAARTALNVLREAREQSDPEAAAKVVGKAFSALRGELALAGALVASARGDDDTGVEIDFNISGAVALDTPEPGAAPAKGTNTTGPKLTSPKTSSA